MQVKVNSSLSVREKSRNHVQGTSNLKSTCNVMVYSQGTIISKQILSEPNLQFITVYDSKFRLIKVLRNVYYITQLRMYILQKKLKY